jgi:hypothetical protein
MPDPRTMISMARRLHNHADGDRHGMAGAQRATQSYGCLKTVRMG